jgi:hypothetical protein
MSPLDPMADAALVDSLTEYYSQYRRFLKEGGDRSEFLACQSKLIRLLSELNHRMGRFADFNHQDEKMTAENSV